VLIGAHQIHQPGAGPIGIAVETGLVGFLALLAIAGERGIDQPVVLRREMIVGDAEPRPHGRRIIGDKDIGLAGELVQHRLSFRSRQIEREAALVAGLQHPREIMFALGIAR
jgi:hypothetical protein